MSGAYHVKALPGQITIIALPPSAQTGIIKFGAVQLRLASDFGGAIRFPCSTQRSSSP
jgi:hypothetical protein